MKWYTNAAVYQIYPRSFADSNNDGIGDLNGITQKLAYLADLGIQAIWLSPFYPSPMADFGYDVSDYCTIEPMFGTLEDFDTLVREAHARNIKVLVDYIPNHTSEKHPWFVESRSSRDNPKRSWYLWEEPKIDTHENMAPPNNWLSIFGGNGWELDPLTNSYYYHSFLKEQPDLNWRNPEVKQAMKEVLRFWLDRKVDGFRMDAVYFMIKDKELRDNPINPQFVMGNMDPYMSQINTYNHGQTETLDILREFADVLSEYKDTFMITEVYLPVPELLKFFKVSSAKIHSPFNMNLISLPWQAAEYKKMIEEIENGIDAEDVPNYVLGNHDKPRIASRLGYARARLVAMFQLTLRGMPFVYYGEEIAMTDVLIPPEEVQDPVEKNVPGFGLGRDPQRTPMQWDETTNAGFSTEKPWLRVSENYRTYNVEAESREPFSSLNLYKKLLALRQNTPALKSGLYQSLESNNADVLAYGRESKDGNVLIVLNFSDQEQTISMAGKGTVLCTTGLDAEEGKMVELNRLHLRPYEGYLFSL
jgi:alpha-glucosidase